MRRIAPPQLPAHLDAVAPCVVEPEQTIEATAISTLQLSEPVCPAVSFDECTFTKTILSSVQLPKATFRDCRIDKGDATAANFSDGGMQRVYIRDVRATGLDCSQSILKDVRFVGCKLDMANFRFAKCSNVVFEDCNLTNADFYSAELTHVRFENCILQATLFSGVTARTVDLRSSDLIDVRGWDNAGGFIIDSQQLIQVAPQLAVALNITIQDD
jgi:uncharacterized protein YjbI with pentapeptide repeats